MQPESITRGLAAFTAILLLAAQPSADSVAWRQAPEYLPLFAPRLHREAYDAYVSPATIEQVLTALTADATARQAPGAWAPRPMLPLEAFGQIGAYDRWRVTHLYGSNRATVARGMRTSGHVTESWTLVSPYPAPGLDRLERGTLLIVLRVP